MRKIIYSGTVFHFGAPGALMDFREGVPGPLLIWKNGIIDLFVQGRGQMPRGPGSQRARREIPLFLVRLLGKERVGTNTAGSKPWQCFAAFGGKGFFFFLTIVNARLREGKKKKIISHKTLRPRLVMPGNSHILITVE